MNTSVRRALAAYNRMQAARILNRSDGLDRLPRLCQILTTRRVCSRSSSAPQ